MFFPKKEALAKLIELGKQNETGEKLAKSVLEFQDHEGFTCPIIVFNLATVCRNRTDEYLSGRKLRDIEESCEFLIDLAKCFKLDLNKILNMTTKSGNTLFSRASMYSETVTRRLLEENVLVNSVNQTFGTPFFRVSNLHWDTLNFF